MKKISVRRRAVFRFLVGAVSLAAALASGVADSAARDDGCILDNCADRAPPRENAAPQSSGAPAGRDFDFYVLALSWSPGYCESVEGARDQCEPGKGLGFVVHGLWPQYERGFPSDCPGPRSPSRIALEKASGLFPHERLARYEWRKHGVCSGKSPSDYFADVARAHAAVTIPAAFPQADARPDICADRRRARFLRSEPAAAAGNDGGLLPPRRNGRRAHLPFEGFARIPRLSRDRAARLPHPGDQRACAALANELSARVSRRQFRRRVQACAARAAVRLSDAQGDAVPSHRHACGRGRL